MIAGHAQCVAVQRLKQRDNVRLEPRIEVAVGRVPYLRVGTDSAACRFGDRAVQMCGHRDTNTYPAIQMATGSITSIPFTVLSIVGSFGVLICAVCGVG